MAQYAQICALYSCFPFHSSTGVCCNLTINVQLVRSILRVFSPIFSKAECLSILPFIFPTYTKCWSLSCCGLHWCSSRWIQWGCTRPRMRFLAHLRMNMSCYLWLPDRKIYVCWAHRFTAIHRPSSLGLYLVALEICCIQLYPTDAIKPCFLPLNN